MFRLVNRLQQEAADLSDHALSAYRGNATVKGFVAEEAFAARFTDHNEAYRRTATERANMRAIIGPMLGLGATVNVFILLFVGGPMAIRGTLTVGELIAFTTLTAYLAGPIRGASFLLSVFKQAEAALERIAEVADPPPDRPDLPHPVAPGNQAPAMTVRHLSFAYPDAPDTPVLHDVSFDVPAGTTVGLFGPTGSGKTTLIRLISRLFNPPPGTITVDGQDLCTVDLDAWRAGLAMVPQRAFLFSESVKDNVLMGAPDDGRLERVLRDTAMDVDIDALPHGADTLVGEAGVMLSGGQRQRAALARGLVRPHHLLILDDVLSAVDHKTERELIETLRAPRETPTTFLVANRISALLHADLVLVIEDGRLTQSGTPAALQAQPGLFQDTWRHQSEAS